MTLGITELPPEGMQLGGVALAGDTDRGTRTTEGLNLLFTTAGITVQGPQPQIERLLIWSALDSATCQEKLVLADGRHAAILELTSGGQAIRFLLPTDTVSPGQAAYLDQALPAWLSRYRGAAAVPVGAQILRMADNPTSAPPPPPPPPPESVTQARSPMPSAAPAPAPTAETATRGQRRRARRQRVRDRRTSRHERSEGGSLDRPSRTRTGRHRERSAAPTTHRRRHHRRHHHRSLRPRVPPPAVGPQPRARIPRRRARRRTGCPGTRPRRGTGCPRTRPRRSRRRLPPRSRSPGARLPAASPRTRSSPATCPRTPPRRTRYHSASSCHHPRSIRSPGSAQQSR